jgi:hypothetical protein
VKTVGLGPGAGATGVGLGTGAAKTTSSPLDSDEKKFEKKIMTTTNMQVVMRTPRLELICSGSLLRIFLTA